MRSLGDDRGSTLIAVVLVSMLVGALGALALANGRQAEWSSASDRNSEQALGVAEAGVHQMVARMESQAAAGTLPTPGPFSGSTPQGSYAGDVYRCANPLPEPCTEMDVQDGYVIVSRGATGGDILGRGRAIRVAIEPPLLFNGDAGYALFSKTSIELKNNDTITVGDVWANENVLVEQGAQLAGSITAARGWIQSDNTSVIEGNVWSGHYNASGGWAIDIGGTVEGWAKASVSVPGCDGEQESNYDVVGGTFGGTVTTYGVLSSGSAPSKEEHVCTEAPTPKEIPTFTFNEDWYDPDTLNTFGTPGAPVSGAVTQMNSYSGPYEGTFLVWDTNPSQANRIDLSGWDIEGDVTIYTNAPIYTASITDDGVGASEKAELVLVTTYQPPTSTGCDVNHDNSDCSIHAKNDLSTSCKTAVLMHAENGPVAIKNNSNMCGSVMSDGILVKNTQDLAYDAAFDRVVGFGPSAFEIGHWEEIPA